MVSSCYGGHSVEETPGSIPNPEAKLDRADGTALGRVWESRSPPDIFHWEWRSAGTPCGGVRLLHSLFSCPTPDSPGPWLARPVAGLALWLLWAALLVGGNADSPGGIVGVQGSRAAMRAAGACRGYRGRGGAGL